MQRLPSRPWKAPRRRFRGKRKYFRRVLRRAEAFRLDTPPGAWWDYWHYHADWPGWGNLAWTYRLEHLRALAVVFRKVVETSAFIPVPFQAWICLDADDAAYDGVFIHSPNPNHSDFPFKPEATWKPGVLNEYMVPLLPGLRLRVGRCAWSEEEGEAAPSVRTMYLVYSEDAGVSLE